MPILSRLSPMVYNERMSDKALAELILFIAIEAVGLLPLGIFLLIRHSSDDPASDPSVRLSARSMYRALAVDFLAIPLFIFLPERRAAVAIFLVVAQVVNLAFFRKGR